MVDALLKRAIPTKIAGVTQLVECDLAKVDVAGSNPVSRSILLNRPKARGWSQNRTLPGARKPACWRSKFVLLIKLSR